jgi:hypothetical protein
MRPARLCFPVGGINLRGEKWADGWDFERVSGDVHWSLKRSKGVGFCGEICPKDEGDAIQRSSLATISSSLSWSDNAKRAKVPIAQRGGWERMISNN